jgi:hypothetical protein
LALKFHAFFPHAAPLCLMQLDPFSVPTGWFLLAERAGRICGRCAAAKESGGKKCWKRKFPGTMPQTFRIFALAILRAGQKKFSVDRKSCVDY